ncbi:MAG: hypothetical protein AB7U20_06640 [Planctomycetaceae bacterium]
MHRITVILAVACCCGLTSGCRKSPYELADVRGTATCNGQPMTSGVVIFSPVPDDRGAVTEKPGKPATDKLDENGKFVLSTYGDEDGAVVGKHTARVSMPSREDDDPPGPPCGGTVFEPGTKTPRVFEIVAGETNEFTLEFSNPRVKTGQWAAP